MLAAESFVPTPVVSPAGHARSFEETEAWVLPLLRRVPITRIVDVTPLDYLELPSYAAVTPLARDLTTHAGKGMTHRAARLSAIMEAIERVCGEAMAPGSEVRRASFRALCQSAGEAVLDPEDCDLPYRSSYHPEAVCSWGLGFDLIQKQHIWVPRDLIISPGTEGIYPGPHTNGLASGNTYTEAALHALCELIERDAIAQHEFCDEFAEATDPDALPPRVLDLETLPVEAQEWRARISRAGLSFVAGELVNDVGVPTFVVHLSDPAYPSPEGPIMRRFGGWGTDLEPRRALLRAVTEAVQARVIVMQGARDTFEGSRSTERPWTLRRYTDFYHAQKRYPFNAHAGSSSGDLLRDLEAVCERVARAGFKRCIVADLTRPDLQVPVVRVLVPGMSGPLRYGKRPSHRQLRRLL
jgi:YcaO-like protein with predicted kinase domain